jgi:hypothetical protein
MTAESSFRLEGLKDRLPVGMVVRALTHRDDREGG